MRVITANRPVTQKRAKTEKKADVAVIALAAVQRAAREAQVGRFMDARVNLYAAERLMKRAATTDTQMEEHVRENTLPPPKHSSRLIPHGAMCRRTSSH
jgi:hypothetical protein